VVVTLIAEIHILEIEIININIRISCKWSFRQFLIRRCDFQRRAYLLNESDEENRSPQRWHFNQHDDFSKKRLHVGCDLFEWRDSISPKMMPSEVDFYRFHYGHQSYSAHLCCFRIFRPLIRSANFIVGEISSTKMKITFFKYSEHNTSILDSIESEGREADSHGS